MDSTTRHHARHQSHRHAKGHSDIRNVNVARAVIRNHMSESQAWWECQVSCWGVPTWLGMMGFNPTYSDVLRHATTVIKTDLDCGRDRQMAQYWHQDKICTGGRYTPYVTLQLFYNNFRTYREYLLQVGFTIGWISPAPTKGDSGGPLSCYPQSRQYNDGQQKTVYGWFRWGRPGSYPVTMASLRSIRKYPLTGGGSNEPPPVFCWTAETQ